MQEQLPLIREFDEARAPVQPLDEIPHGGDIHHRIVPAVHQGDGLVGRPDLVGPVQHNMMGIDLERAMSLRHREA